MKVFVSPKEKNSIDTYYRQNGMYQTTVKYMKILKESGRFSHSCWSNSASSDSELKAVIVSWHYNDVDDTDTETAKEYHCFNGEYDRLPYETSNDIALDVVDDSCIGEVSFIFHDGTSGIYDEIRYINQNVSVDGGYTLIDEI